MLGLGTAALGRPQYINIRQKNSQHTDLLAFKEASITVLEKAYRMGIRYFDTAPGYGMAEELLLEWLQTKNDPTIVVATKWGYTYVADFKPEALQHEIKEHSLLKLNQQWEVSKAFLSYLKVYQIHSATLETGVLENQSILKRLAHLKEEYQIEIGITTTGANQVEVIRKALTVSVDGVALFDTFQVTYNMLDQSLLVIYPELLVQNKKVIIKEALANGRIFRNSKYPHYDALYAFLEQLAIQYQVGVDAIALQFCTQTIQNGIVLSGASDCDQLQSNLSINRFRLNSEEIETLQSFKVISSDYWSERKRLEWN